MKKKTLHSRILCLVLALIMAFGLYVPGSKSHAAGSSYELTNRDMRDITDAIYCMRIYYQSEVLGTPDYTEDYFDTMYFAPGEQTPDAFVHYYMRAYMRVDPFLWQDYLAESMIQYLYEVPYEDYIAMVDCFFENHSDMKSYLLEHGYYDESTGYVALYTLDGMGGDPSYYDYLGTNVTGSSFQTKLAFMEDINYNDNYVNTDNAVLTFSVPESANGIKISGFQPTDDTSIPNPLVDAFSRFADVTPDQWYYDYVEFAYYEGLMTGLNPYNFGSASPLARAQFAVILFRFLALSEGMEYTDRFLDIPANTWFTDAVLWAASDDVGIISGYSNGRFGPYDSINREQLAVMMYRAARYLELDTSDMANLASFEDYTKVSSFATDAMSWAVAVGIISGKYNQTILDPQGYASRAECAAILMRFLQYVDVYSWDTALIQHTGRTTGSMWLTRYTGYQVNESALPGQTSVTFYSHFSGDFEAEMTRYGKEVFENRGVSMPETMLEFAAQESAVQKLLPDGCEFTEDSYGNLAATWSWTEEGENGSEEFEMYYVLKQGEESYGTIAFRYDPKNVAPEDIARLAAMAVIF